MNSVWKHFLPLRTIGKHVSQKANVTIQRIFGSFAVYELSDFIRKIYCNAITCADAQTVKASYAFFLIKFKLSSACTRSTVGRAQIICLFEMRIRRVDYFLKSTKKKKNEALIWFFGSHKLLSKYRFNKKYFKESLYLHEIVSHLWFKFFEFLWIRELASLLFPFKNEIFGSFIPRNCSNSEVFSSNSTSLLNGKNDYIHAFKI